MLSAIRLGVSWFTLFIIGTDLFVVSPILPLIARDFQADTQTTGLTVMTFALGYVIAAPVFGHVADRLGRRRVLTVCLLVFAASNMLTAEAHHLSAMLAVRLLCGIAAAGVTPSIYVLAGTSAPAGRRGTWIAIVLTGLLSSLPLGASIGAVLSLAYGWPAIFFGLAGCGFLLVPVHWSIWPGNPHTPGVSAIASDNLDGVTLARYLAPTVAWSTALYGIYTYLGAGLTALGYSPEEIARIVLIYGAAAFAGALIGGRIADRFGPTIAMRVSLIGLCVCLTVLRFALGAGFQVATAFAVTSLFAQIFFPAQQSRLLNAFPTRNSSVLAWNNSALFLGMAIGSLVGGQLMVVGGFIAIPPISATIAIVGWVSLKKSATGFQFPRAM